MNYKPIMALGGSWREGEKQPKQSEFLKGPGVALETLLAPLAARWLIFGCLVGNIGLTCPCFSQDALILLV